MGQNEKKDLAKFGEKFSEQKRTEKIHFKEFLWKLKSLYALKVIFITEFEILGKIFSFYELSENNLRMGEFESIFLLDVQERSSK